MAKNKTCKNCGKPIKQVMMALGSKWMHYVVGASNNDSDYWFCHLTTAEPEERKRKAPESMPPGRFGI